MAQSARHKFKRKAYIVGKPVAVASTGRRWFCWNNEELRRSVRSTVDSLIGRRTIRRARRIFWRIIYTESYWSVSEIHKIFGRYLLLYYYLSKSRVFTERFRSLVVFWERYNEETRACGSSFVPCNSGNVQCACARKKCIRKNVHARKNHDENEGARVRHGILLANECDCKWHQKGENEMEQFFFRVGTNDLSWSHYKFTEKHDRMHFRCIIYILLQIT